MRRILAGGIWLLLFCVMGAGIAAAVAVSVLHAWAGPVSISALAVHDHTQLITLGLWAAGGAGIGFALFGLLGATNVLPGLRTKRSDGPVWDVPEALLLLLNFFTIQVVGSGLCAVVIWLIVSNGGHRPTSIFDLITEIPVFVSMAVCGYVAAVLFALLYVRRAGPARLRSSAAEGLAWRAAPKSAYGVAAGLAVVITLTVVLIYHLFPVDPRAVQNSPLEKAFATPGWPAVALVVLALFLAPPAEELVFRGGVFAGLATRFGPWGAAIGSTLLFVVAHAQEKLHYPPGFIDVGLVAAAAAWLRLRYGSIRPGIALHLLYNLGVTLVSSTIG